VSIRDIVKFGFEDLICFQKDHFVMIHIFLAQLYIWMDISL